MMRRRLGAAFVVLCAAWSAPASAQTVCHISVDGAIGPATSGYISRALTEAAEQNAQCLVIRLDTPGGLLDSTKTIVQLLLAAELPVVVYVAPGGASATSAGCFITLAADVAAMAPTTTIGAAHPVSIGGGGGGEQPDETMKQKVANYSISFIESIAARRGRNVSWARSAVRDSVSITAEEAKELGVIDLLAADMSDLLKQLNGREVGGKSLATADARLVEIPMTAREKAFQLMWRPEVLFILMLVAIYGIVGELSNPGALFPGIIGVIALVLVLYLSAVLPINIAGLLLIGVALLLFVADVFTPTHGALTVGGVIAFFLGSLMLFDRAEPFYRLSLGMIAPASLLTGAFFAFVVGAGLRAQFLPVRAGPETLIGQVVPALTRIDARGGKLLIEGETWNAVSDVPIDEQERVRIVERRGLTLTVRPMTDELGADPWKNFSNHSP